MHFKHTEHTQKYFSKCKSLAEELTKYDWNSVRGFQIDFSKGDDSLKYQFLKFSSKLYTKVQETNSKNINKFLNDPNVLSLGIIDVLANSKVEIHKDHDYWSALFYRVQIPINAPGAVFIYGGEEIVWETEKVYIFDVMNVPHGAKNDTDQNFQMVYIDISQSAVTQTEQQKPVNTIMLEYQKKVLDNIPHDLIFNEYKKYCTEEELKAQEEYLDHYNRNLEIG